MKETFSNALVRLTTAYVIGLAVVCLLFSGFIYQLASREIDKSSRRQIVGFRNQMGNGFIIDERATEEVRILGASEARSRLKVQLLLANLVVIGAGSILAYIFAKKTLEPIQENVKAQERFTSDASHELRTPLAAMRSEIEVALRDKSLKISEAKELLLSNLEEVNSMHAMTESLLCLARNNELGEKQQVDVAKVIEDTVKKYEESARIRKISIVTKLKNTKLAINKDAIGQSVGILLDNAIQYAGEGSKISISSSLKNDIYTISVADNGVGMSDDLVSRIFERFTRADESRSHQNTYGHGLGLSIAKQLVGAMDGIITVESTVGKGSVFRIMIPAGVES